MKINWLIVVSPRINALVPLEEFLAHRNKPEYIIVNGVVYLREQWKP